MRTQVNATFASVTFPAARKQLRHVILAAPCEQVDERPHDLENLNVYVFADNLASLFIGFVSALAVFSFLR